MKTVHLSTVHTTADSRIMEKEARALVAAGWNVAVVIPHDKDEMRGRVKIIRVRKPSSRLVRVTLTALMVGFKALKERGDVYHFHDPELLPVGLVLRMLGKKVIYDVHETHSASVAHRSHIPSWLRRPLARLVKGVEIAAANQLTGIVAATPAIAEQFKEVKAKRVVVQNFPLLESDGRPRTVDAADRLPIAVYMGAMSEGRGVLTMVQAMALVPDSLGVTLTLAGTLSPGLLAKIQTQPGVDKVNVAGRLTHEKLRDLLGRARLGLVVLHPEPNYVNSFPTKMFEYMAAGLPIIASNFPLWRSIVAENRCGLVVDPLDIRQIAEAIEYLMTNEVEAGEMGERGIQLVHRQYNWSTERKKLVSFYERIRRN